MPSDAIVRLTEERSKLVMQFLRDALDVNLPLDSPVSVTSLQALGIPESIATSPESLLYDATATRQYAAGFAAGFAAGEARARAEVMRGTMRVILEARDHVLSEDQDQRIEECDDLAALKRWAEAALTASNTGDIFR